MLSSSNPELQPFFCLGVGCERDVSPDEVRTLALEVMASAGLEPGSIHAVASIETRRHEPALLSLAALFGCPLTSFSAARLEQETPRLLNPSAAVFARVGCHGVAEAAALAAAGRSARLVVGKTKSRHATVAVAGRERL